MTIPKEQLEKSSFRRGPRTIDTEQLEYSAKQIFTYGVIAVAASTLFITYAWLLIQKIKA